MPKAPSVRHTAHHASVKPPKVTIDEQDIIVDGVQPDEVQLSTGKILKRVEKHQAFLQKLEPSIKKISRSHTRHLKRQARNQPGDGLNSLHTGIAMLDEGTVLERETGAETGPVSRSHGRRLKRKAKEQLGGGLGDLHNAIETMVDNALLTDAAAEGEASLKSSKPGVIGKGSSSTLSRSQRKRVLELERIRHPLILNNSEFSSNPFQTIRTHAQNTILQKGTAA